MWLQDAVLVYARFSPVFGTVERALRYLKPFNADCRLLCPRSEQTGDHRPHRCMRASFTVDSSGIANSDGLWNFQHGLLESS